MSSYFELRPCYSECAKCSLILVVHQHGGDAARVRAVPHARAEAHLVLRQRAGRAARRAGTPFLAPRMRLAQDALQYQGDFTHDLSAFIKGMAKQDTRENAKARN
jgi:hypothetical protein